MAENDTRVLILGSAPAALAAREWARGPFTHIVAINNAWRIREDWDFLIHPEDFPAENRPDCLTATQHIVTAPATWELTGRLLLDLPTEAGMV